MGMTARWLAIALLISCWSSVNAASSGSTIESATLYDGSSYQTELNSLTNVRLHMRDGDFRIIGSDSDEIAIHTEGKNRALAQKMQVQLKRTGDSLEINFLHVPKNEFQVTIAVPKETSLYARMRGGDLSVAGVSGDKDLELTGGDMSVQVPDPSDYGPVDLKVKFGDVSGSPFGDPKGWVGNSLKMDRSGRFRLHAHVLAGDLVLKP
jgi:hypothetical protein